MRRLPAVDRETRVVDWLARLRRRDATTWDQLWSLAAELAAREGARDPEDMAASIVERQFESGGSDLRRARPETSMGAWVRGCVRMLIRRERRAGHNTAGSLGSLPAATDRRRSRETSSATRDLQQTVLTDLVAERLTAKQRDAITCDVEGLSERAAARRLGVSRDTYRDRRDRAIATLSRSVPSRDWALRAAKACEAQRDAENARLFQLYAGGSSIEEIARSLELSRATVRGRVARWRSRL